MDKFSTAEIRNPKRTIERRLVEAEAPDTAASASAPSGPRFGRQWTPAERAMQAQKLADKLRTR